MLAIPERGSALPFRTHCDPSEAQATEVEFHDVIDFVYKYRKLQVTFVVSGTAPFTTAYKVGSRYLGKSSARRALVARVDSEGLMTQAFPAAMAPDYRSSVNTTKLLWASVVH